MAPSNLTIVDNAPVQQNLVVYGVSIVTDGQVLQEMQIGQGTAFEPLQIAGNPGHGRVSWQGVLSGLVRIGPLEE